MTDSPQVLLAVEGLSVQTGGRDILRSVNFELRSGDICAILGPNGAGKTTLLRSLLGMQDSVASRLEVVGKSQPPAQRRLLIGYVPQVKRPDAQFPALALELVASGLLRRWPWRVRGEVRQRAMAALEQVGAAGLAFRTVATLSGGEMQRVYLARGMVRRPRLLMLDEPMTGIDAGGEADFLRLVEAYALRESAAILMVTHDWSAALHHANRLLILNGRVVYFGDPNACDVEAKLSEAFGHRHHQHPLVGIEHPDHVGPHAHHHHDHHQSPASSHPSGSAPNPHHKP